MRDAQKVKSNLYLTAETTEAENAIEIVLISAFSAPSAVRLGGWGDYCSSTALIVAVAVRFALAVPRFSGQGINTTKAIMMGGINRMA